jgi:autotransporter translocation and assembly factor TamB
VLAKAFRLKSGSARFLGGDNIIPELQVVAEHKAKDLIVFARANGPATNPAISLSSSPEVPQDEIVSRVLFGKNRSQLSALEAAQLAAAVAELTGTGGGVGSLDFARSLLGVDRLSIGTTGTGDAAAPAVEAGKYVSDEVYIGVKKGVTDQSGTVGVEVEITPNISVESETGTTGKSDIGVKFKWDY